MRNKKKPDVDVKLTNYTPNAIEVFEADEAGEEYLKFVESGEGGRHDHYIKKGATEEVHGVLVGFDSPTPNTIDFVNNSEDYNTLKEIIFKDYAKGIHRISL